MLIAGVPNTYGWDFLLIEKITSPTHYTNFSLLNCSVWRGKTDVSHQFVESQFSFQTKEWRQRWKRELSIWHISYECKSTTAIFIQNLFYRIRASSQQNNFKMVRHSYYIINCRGGPHYRQVCYWRFWQVLWIVY